MSSRSTDRTRSAVGAGSPRTLATYPTYREAERAVDHQSDRKFPVEHVAIVGHGLRSVEQVTAAWTGGRPRCEVRSRARSPVC
ncbi:MAG TPA: general stress protein [Conexibacter sp.]|jgi:hypothetical protein|nr:general stress protein [Conexibacter sp.]